MHLFSTMYHFGTSDVRDQFYLNGQNLEDILKFVTLKIIMSTCRKF